MKSILTPVDRALEWSLVALMTALVVSVSWQVGSRYLLSSPSPWTEELARFLLIWIGTLGGAYAFRTHMHIGLDLLPARLSGEAAVYLRRFTLLAVMVFAAAVLVYGGSNLVYLTWDLRQTSAVMGLPMSFVYSVIPLTGLLIVAHCSHEVFYNALIDTQPDTSP